MKKIITIALILGAMFVNAQDASKVFSATEMTFFGADFTKAKFVAEKEVGSELKYEVIPGINTLMVSEQAKNYNLKMAFQKDVVYYDPTSVNALNSKIDGEKLVVFNPIKIEKADLDAMVKNYSSAEKKEGLGLVFIAENCNKAEQIGTFWITFFDIASKKVLLAEKMSGKPKGLTVTNYWAGSIKEILKQLEKGTYSSWKK